MFERWCKDQMLSSKEMSIFTKLKEDYKKEGIVKAISNSLNETIKKEKDRQKSK